MSLEDLSSGAIQNLSQSALQHLTLGPLQNLSQTAIKNPFQGFPENLSVLASGWRRQIESATENRLVHTYRKIKLGRRALFW